MFSRFISLLVLSCCCLSAETTLSQNQDCEEIHVILEENLYINSAHIFVCR